MLVINIQPNGWSCSCDDEFRSELTGASAHRKAVNHAIADHRTVEVRIDDNRRKASRC